MADDFARQLLDALYNPETQPPQQPSRPLREKLAGAAETVGTLGSGLLASVPAGLAGLTQLIPTRGHRPSLNRAAEKVEEVQSALTRLPRGEAGQEYLEKTAGALGVLGMPAEFLGEQTLKLTGSPFLATVANVGLDPVNYIGMPGSGRAIVAGTKAAGRAAAAAPRVAGEMAQDLLMGQGRMEGQRGAIKMKGGNWLANEVEGVTEPLRQTTPGGYMDAGEALAEMRRVYPPETTNPDLLRRQEPMMRTLEASAALNNWIDKKLNRYIRNEMATPEDPVRKLAEQGILHFNPQADAFVRSEARDRRMGEGNQLGVTPLAKAWEDNSDLFIIPSRAEDFQSYSPLGGVKSNNPWLDKVPPETKVYEAASTGIDNLGFEHLIDELKNSIRPDSDLPAHLRWKPEDLEKVTMEQAVKRVHDINEYRAQKKAEANEVLARNPATATFKEYPTIPGTDLPNERGLAWKEIKPPEMSVELPQGWSEPVQKGNALQSKSVDGGIALGADLPDLIKNIYKRHPETPGNPRKALEEALKYEGDVMGHCVGGYCDDVLSGRTKIYSLRDNKGEPLVTIEVKPKTRSLTNRTDWFTSQPEDVQNKITTEALALEKSLSTGLEFGSRENWQKAFASVIDKNMGEELPAIEQIKGSGKKDRSQRLRIKETGYKDEPDAYLLPFIQDFVRSGNWSLVNDIQNTGLITPDRVLSSETRKRLEAQGVQIPKYMTEQEAKELSKQAIRASDIPTLDQSAGGMKRGGSVHISDNPDTMQLELAKGGGVGEKRDLASKIAGGGIRGIITRGLLGMDPPEDMTPREREIYENTARASAPAQGLGVGKAIFIGATAKTWNKAAAARAVELEKAGVSPEQIWRETGTFRGADGKLRQEISDVGAFHRNPKELQELGKAKKEEARELQLRLVGTPGQKDLFPKALTEAKRPVREQVKQLKEEADQLMRPSDTRGQSARFALEHPELYKAYPELGDIPVYQGVYGSGRELGSLRGVAGDLEMSVTQSGLRKGPRSTMLHEMQHAVQSLEGMSPGGSSTMAFQDPKAFEILKQLREEVRKPPSFEEFQRLNKYPESEAQNAYAQFLKEREANPILHPAIERSLQERAANEYYKRLAGEVEARATQYREGMGPTQRRQEFPYSSYDVLPDDLIVKPPRSGLPITAEAVKPTAEQAAIMAAQRAEMALRSRAMQELKDQFENLPQPPKGFLSSESILQRMDEIRRREATPSGEQIPLLKKGGGVEMQAGGALKAAAKAAAKAAETTKKVSTNAAPLTPLQSIQQGGYKIPPGGLSSEDKAALRPLYNQGLVKVEERGQEKFIVPGRGAWFEFATPEQKKALDQFQVAQNLKDLSFMGPTESLLNSAQASFYDFEISPGVRSIPIKMFEPLIGGYDSAHESKRIQDLTRAIQQSKQIEPLFVGLDPTGEPYIMEGQHRVRALKALGYDQIPARVVVDMDDITKAKGGAVSKRSGKVSITDNLDTMRLAVQKRK